MEVVHKRAWHVLKDKWDENDDTSKDSLLKQVSISIN